MAEKRELMWACGVLPADIIDEIDTLCLSFNEDLGLSRRFIDFPLHVSFKRSFYTADFVEVKSDLKKLICSYGRIECGEFYLKRMKDMIWLCFEDQEDLLNLHEQIDRLLKDKYGIAIDHFDEHYLPHATLFKDEDQGKLDKMYERLVQRLVKKETEIVKAFIGSRRVANEFFDLRV